MTATSNRETAKLMLARVPVWLYLVLAFVGAIAMAVVGPVFGLILAVPILGLVGLYAAAYLPGVVLAIYLLIGIYKGGIQPFLPIDISVVLAALNALQVLPVVLDRRTRHISRAGLSLWVSLAFLLIAGLTYAPDKPLAFLHVVLFWGLVFIPLLPAAIRVGSDPRYVRQFVWAVFGMGLPMVLLGVSQLSSTERLVVLGANTIEVSRAALLIPLLAVMFLFREHRPVLSAATLVLIPLAIIVAIASGSRGPLLILVALAAVGVVRYFLHWRSVNWRRTGAVVGLAAASLLLIIVASSQLSGQSTQRFSLFADFVDSALSGDLNTAVGDTSAGTRVQLFGLAETLFETHPILGVGPAGFEALSPRFLSPIEAEQYPHNALLQFEAEYGLVGTAVFVGLVLLALTRPLPRVTTSGAIRVVFVFWLLNAMVSGDIFGDREAWGFLLMLLFIDSPRPDEVAASEAEWVAAPAGRPTLAVAPPGS